MSSTTMSSERQMRATTLVDGGVDLGSADGEGEALEGEPADPHAGVDDGVGEGFDEVALAGARRSGDGQVLGPADPFEGAQGGLGGCGDGGVLGAPGVEGLAGGEAGGVAALAAGGGVAAGGIFFEQDPQDLGVIPALGPGGGEHLGGGGADVGQAHAAQHGGELVGDRRWGRRLHRSASVVDVAVAVAAEQEREAGQVGAQLGER